MRTSTAALTALAPYGSLAEAYNTIGITERDTYAKGDFDGAGNSFAGELLAEPGCTPGATVTVNGAEFTWPQAAPGMKSLVKGVTHPILVSAPSGTARDSSGKRRVVSKGAAGEGTHLALLGSGASTRASGTVIVIHTDGTSSTRTLTYPNWSFQDPSVGGSRLAVSAKGRYTPNGPATPVLTGESDTVSPDVDVTGGRILELRVGSVGDGVGSDHGDWADAKLACAEWTEPE